MVSLSMTLSNLTPISRLRQFLDIEYVRNNRR